MYGFRVEFQNWVFIRNTLCFNFLIRGQFNFFLRPQDNYDFLVAAFANLLDAGILGV